MDVPDIPLRDITPLPSEGLVKLLKSINGRFLLVQLSSGFAKLFRVVLRLFLVLTRPLLLQLDNLSGVEVALRKVATEDDLDVVQIPLEGTESADSNVLGTCASTFELVHLINRLAEDMMVTDTKSPCGGVSMLVTIHVETEAEGALGIIHLHLRGSKGNPESSSQMMVDVDGRVIGADRA